MILKNSKQLKKLLILAYDFPPYVSVGGLRPYSWFKYLKEYGVEPVVVTRQWSNEHGNHLDYIAPSWSVEVVVEELEEGTIIRSPYAPNLSNRLLLKYGENRLRFFRKMISAFYEFAQFLLPIGPKIELYKAAQDYLKSHKVDAIIATGDPFVLFHYAEKLRKEFDVPWVADYRDLWVDEMIPNENRLTLFLKGFVQKRISQKASLLTTVCSFFEVELQKTFKDKRIVKISNGFDPDIIKNRINVDQYSDMLTISLAGSILHYHPIEKFLKEINSFIETSNVPIRLNFYGINNSNFWADLIKHNYPSVYANCNFYKSLNNLQLIHELQKSHCLLLFNYYLIPGTKVYDYLATRRLILFCFENDLDADKAYYSGRISKDFFKKQVNEQTEILNKTKAGIVLKSSDELKTVFNRLYDEFKLTQKIKCESKNIDEFSRLKGVEILAREINNLIKKQ